MLLVLWCGLLDIIVIVTMQQNEKRQTSSFILKLYEIN